MAGGRPKKTIDLNVVRELAKIHCTQEEIASFLHVSVDTLQRNQEFCGVYKECLDLGRQSLRRMQWKMAEEGNVTMLIWLGKQLLRQKDKNEITGEDGGAILIKVVKVDGNTP